MHLKLRRSPVKKVLLAAALLLAPSALAAGPTVTAIGVVKGAAGTQVTISGDAELAHEYFVVEGKSLVIDIPGAASKVWPADQTIGDESVSRVRVAEQTGAKPSVRVVFDLRRPETFTVRGEGKAIVVDFASPRRADAGAPGRVSRPAPSASAAAADASATSAPQQSRPAAAPAGARTLTLDFVDADLADIFRLIADVAEVNIIATDDVKGKRSVKLSEVPWDQALDLILRTNVPQLTRVDDGPGVIRVTTLQRILDEESLLSQQKIKRLEMAAREQEMSRKAAEAAQAEALAEAAQRKEEAKRQRPLATRSFSVSYGNTKVIAERLKAYAADAKDCANCIFEVDERSNRIQVRDLPESIASMVDVFAALDEPTPAVMVEARIVEVLSNLTENLGIQWGANYAADAAHGNATRWTFPNSIGIAGTAVQGEGLNPGNYFVNLPAAASVGGVGLSFGHIANTFSLDVKLSALESLGKTKILSNPKVLVIQNEEAKINVGSQLPIPKTDAEGNRTIEWKDVGILLQVKPQVTNDGSVFMKVQIEQSARGETVRTTEGDMFSIERRGADTKVLVGDGETTVIGGIFIQTATENQSGVPWLSKLPGAGWLFKSTGVSNDRKELMIFLTPRINHPERKAAPTAEARVAPVLYGAPKEPAPAAAPAATPLAK